MTELINHLRPYQRTVFSAVYESVLKHRGLTFSVEIARQGGKNEISSQLELILLSYHAHESKNLIKCSPTFKPQTIVSMTRLKDKIAAAGLESYCSTEMGYIIKLGECRAIFLSADKSANVVGNTAHLLLEVDEAQDVNEDKYTKVLYLQLSHFLSSHLHSRALEEHQLPNPKYHLQRPALLHLMSQE